MSTESPETGSVPLVLVVEDEETARSLRSDALRDAGCAVIPADSVESALMVLRDGPSVDLIVTDIHLGGSGSDKGGVDLAAKIRSSYDSELPVAAYSAKYSDREFTESERELFVARQPKGNQTMKQQEQFYAACRRHALSYRELRTVQNRRLARETAEPHAVQSQRGFVAPDDASDVDAVIAAMGYELRLLSSSAFKELAQTVALWIRRTPHGITAQVCGQPYLQWEDVDEKRAVDGLVHLMVGYASDFSKLKVEPKGPARRMRDYLEAVVRSNALEEFC